MISIVVVLLEHCPQDALLLPLLVYIKDLFQVLTLVLYELKRYQTGKIFVFIFFAVTLF